LTGAPSFEERIFNELSSMRAEMSATRADFTNHFGAMETRFDGLESRLVSVEGELGSIKERLDTVEEHLTLLDDKVDARLRETRPIWEGVQARLTEIESTLTDINRQFKTLIMDSFKLRVRVESLEDARRSPAT
jgi:chromosome segregation ATPase